MLTKTELFKLTDTVGSIVAQCPALARVFEQVGIDYCCGGKIPLAQACQKKGIDPQQLLAKLEGTATGADDAGVNVATMSLTALTDHIEATHHAYLKAELPRLEMLTQKVVAVHGDHDARLAQVRDTFTGLAAEMASHMLKEEQILFPMVRKLEASPTLPVFHCRTLANPIRQIELEHDQAGGALAKMRALTDDFTAPDWVCNTYRAMLDALAQLEHDLHQHVHKENNILFPRAMALEAERQPV